MSKSSLLSHSLFGIFVFLVAHVSNGQTAVDSKPEISGPGASAPPGRGANAIPGGGSAKVVSKTETEPSTKLENSKDVSALLPPQFDPKIPDTPTLQATPIDDKRLQVNYRDKYGFKWTLEIQISDNTEYLYFQLPCQPISAINREARLRQLLETNSKLGLIRFEMYRDTDMIYLTLPIENYAITESILLRKIVRLVEAAREIQDKW
jgi:hypothetical protein